MKCPGVFRWVCLAFFSAVLAFGLAQPVCTSVAPGPGEEGELTMTVSSPAFADGGRIPAKYTCSGENMSPPLTWGGQPAATKVFALVVDDPDAAGGVFTHWIVFNLPADSRQLPEAVPTQEQLSSGALQGKNDFGRIGYGGPCPPPGEGVHHYEFTVYALDKTLSPLAGVSSEVLKNAMHGHILARGQLTGTFER